MENKIKQMYDEMFKSKQAELLKAKEQKLNDLATEENENKGLYQTQRNAVAYDTSRNTQAIRDTMAKNNLLGSGENVDSLLRNNTDYSNRMGNIDSNEGKFLNNITRQRNLINSEYQNDLNKYKSDIEAQKQQALIEYLNQIRQEQLAAASRSYSGGGGSGRSYSGGGSSTSYSKSGANTYADAIENAFQTAYKSKDINSATEIMNDAKVALAQGYISQQKYNSLLNHYNGLQKKTSSSYKPSTSSSRNNYASAW